MRWIKINGWKAGIAVVDMLVLLVFILWVATSAVGAYDGTPGLAGPRTITVQATPTEDATVTALNKEKLVQEIQQLKNQNSPDLFGWLQTNVSIFLSTLIVVIGGLFGLGRWLMDRRDAHDKELDDRQAERDRRAEERFQAVVTGLGDEKEGAKIGAAILLRSFLRPDYKQFYTQTFDLAVANLRLPRTPSPTEDPDGVPHPSEDLNTPQPLTTLRQALIVVFKEAFPLARNTIIGDYKYALQSMDATDIKLDNAFLQGADLKQIWMPHASLQQTNLDIADLSGADLSSANLTGASLNGANLTDAYLRGAVLTKTNLTTIRLINARLRDANLVGANLTDAYLNGAHFRDANLSKAKLIFAKLSGASFTGADLSYTDLGGANLSNASLNMANLSNANLTGADLSNANLTGANITDARSLVGTKLIGVKGLTDKQLEACKAKGALIDGDLTPSSSQSIISP